jgi:hypothetical protein
MVSPAPKTDFPFEVSCNEERERGLGETITSASGAILATGELRLGIGSRDVTTTSAEDVGER